MDCTGIYKADVGIKDGKISGIGKSGNPHIMDGVTPGMIVGASTEAIAGEGLILTAGGIDSHIHFISPTQVRTARAGRHTAIIITMNELKRLYMLQICDSLFPIGAFTLSNGLETYVQRGAVHSPETLAAYLADYLALAPYQELGVAALAMQYASELENWQRLDRLYTACRAPMEVRQGSAKLCMRLIKAAEQIAPVESLREYRACIADGTCTGQHPIAVGLFAAAHKVKMQEALSIYGYSLLSGLTTHAAKCVPLRQLEAQRVLRESFPRLLDAVQTALSVTEDEIGIGGPAFDIFAMQHETLYSRLYMS